VEYNRGDTYTIRYELLKDFDFFLKANKENLEEYLLNEK